MIVIIRKLLPLFVLPALAGLGLSACTQAEEVEFYSGTAFAELDPELPFTEARFLALQEAEKKARDEILRYMLDLQFQGGRGSLQEAMITDPFIRTKVYDTIRTARVVDRVMQDDDVAVSVTVRIELRPLMDILSRYPPSPAG